LIGGASNKSAPAPQGSRPAQGVRPAGKRRARRQSRSRQSFVIWSSLSIAATVIAAATLVSAIFGSASAPNRSAETVSKPVDRYGTITLNPGSSHCEQKVFDNDAGSFVEIRKSCADDVDARLRDTKAPLGTMQTLNAISKSFKSDSAKQ
jgi:hypothetical protein